MEIRPKKLLSKECDDILAIIDAVLEDNEEAVITEVGELATESTFSTHDPNAWDVVVKPSD